MKNYVGFHGTSETIAEEIIINSFLIDHISDRLPCDLGKGVYIFENSEKYNCQAKEQAMKYVKKYKNGYKNPTVLKVDCHVDSDKELDMNLSANKKVFHNFMNENAGEIAEERKALIQDGAYKRGNLDGLVIELILEHYNKVVDLVIKDTYTSFNDIPGYKVSNFDNASEICIRNTDIIQNICVI
ncbi:hypothetical protein [Carnobacterium funditum]|uniref:hypothetical protein n=1 Tax=Carnobacterium funditum TaxID=2752 RepID=UPI0005572326|nr:hypothetical protein [Carnobacterium funditum]